MVTPWEADTPGGGLAALGSKTVVYIGPGSEIQNCKADFGGGLVVENGALAQIVGASLVGNAASIYDGGAAYVFKGDSKLIAEGTVFPTTLQFDTVAPWVWRSRPLFTLAASSFEGNAAHNGGAVYAWNIDGAARVHVTTSMFRGNKAAVTAGGLFADNLKNLCRLLRFTATRQTWKAVESL